MSKTMQAAVVGQSGKPLVLEEWDIPEVGHGEITVKTEASGLWQTDPQAARGDWPVKPTPPFVPGHEAIEGHLTSLVGRTVIAANDIVSAWAMLYAAVSGHSLPFAGSLFDKWAREAVQRDRIARIARENLQKLQGELDQVESLLGRAAVLAKERDLLVSQPWSIGHLKARLPDIWAPALRGDAAVEREAQFEWLLANLQQLYGDVMQVAEELRASQDVEKMRIRNRSAVLAAEFKFGKKAMPKTGPRHKEWHQALDA